MSNKRFLALAVASLACLSNTHAFITAPTSTAITTSPKPLLSPLFSTPPQRTTNASSSNNPPPPPLSTLVNRVAVAGATGRTGRLVVQTLLSQNVPVLALVRDPAKAATTLEDPTNELLTIRKTDLGSKEDVLAALASSATDNNNNNNNNNNNGGGGVDAVIWCATGFSDAPDQSIWTKLQALFGLAVTPKGTIDAVGLPALAEGLKKSSSSSNNNNNNSSNDIGALPKIVMLSSAGVTRPSWSEEKKLALEGCAGIPIVRLNPFGILDVKRESEEKLRTCGVDYTIFRPCGLNDSWPSNQRPIFSQGDIAVGRINRQDVAQILVSLLSTPEATGKTFEAITIANSDGYYPPASSLGTALGRLESDSVNGGKGPSEDVVKATYALMQQLLPGEKQDASQLAMGQTYEQLDKDEVGRLGKKGEENVAGAGLTPSS